ncbi:hypothetical protein ACFV3R_02960 [Streptomyces sp. NPDC059740]|uniref:hypothetical protein n=1 Tax=Streptomyces sp. NPDC059740 TaxID=3346926 RepID=UPI00364C20BD
MSEVAGNPRRKGEAAVSGVGSLAAFIATGRFCGLGIGSSLAEVDQAVRVDCIEETDAVSSSLRRDYGLVEVYFAEGPEWAVTGMMLEQHRLAFHPELLAQWGDGTGVLLPRHVTWEELRRHLSRTPHPPGLECISQGEYVEYRAAGTRVSVIVLDGHEEYGDRPRPGDVFSISLG